MKWVLRDFVVCLISGIATVLIIHFTGILGNSMRDSIITGIIMGLVAGVFMRGPGRVKSAESK